MYARPGGQRFQLMQAHHDPEVVRRHPGVCRSTLLPHKRMHLQGQLHVQYARAGYLCVLAPLICPTTTRTMTAIDTHSPYLDTVCATDTACCPSAQPRPASMPAQE